MELGGGVRGENPDFLLAWRRGQDGRPLGFLRLVPCFGDDPGWSLDLMQRDPDAPNGMTEYLIANAALALGERGFRRLSMNFAAWGRLFDERADLSLGAADAEEGRRRSSTRTSRSSRCATSTRSSTPTGLPRSIVVEDVESMPKVGVLYASVEGFLNVPVIGKRLLPPLRAGADAETAGPTRPPAADAAQA